MVAVKKEKCRQGNSTLKVVSLAQKFNGRSSYFLYVSSSTVCGGKNNDTAI